MHHSTENHHATNPDAGDGKYCVTAGQDRTVRLYNPHRGDPDKEGRARAPGQLEEGLLVKSYAGPHG